MCSIFNDFFKDILKIITKKRKIFPKEYTNNAEMNNLHTVTSTRNTIITNTRENMNTDPDTITLKNNEEFNYYVNELAEWTYITEVPLRGFAPLKP